MDAVLDDTPPTAVRSLREGSRLVGRLAIGMVFALLTLLLVTEAVAQVPTDTTRADTTQTLPTRMPADTTHGATQGANDTAGRPAAPPADTVGTPEAEAPFAPLPPLPPPDGRAVLDSLPARTSAVTPIDLLERVPGTFVYDLGAVAWPHGWSRTGLAPHRWSLTLDGHPYDDPLTGRPRLDLLPPSFLQSPRLGVSTTGQPDGVHLRWREYLTQPPVTELRFRRDSNGLQNIEVAHSQLRQFTIGGQPTLLQTTVGYGGRATGGVYEGSDVRRGRLVWARLRIRRNAWTATLSDLSVRHKIGVHGGVEPPLPGVFASIYLLPLAETASQNNDARQQTFRNDLTLRVRGPLLPGRSRPATLSLRWTANTSTFFTDFDGDTALADTAWDARTHGIHASVQQPLRVGAHRLTAQVRGRWQTVGRSNIPALTGSRYAVHGTVYDSLRFGKTRLHLTTGYHATSLQHYPSATARITRSLGHFALHTDLSVTGQPIPWLLETGFSTLVDPLEDAPEPTDLVGRAEAGLAWASDPLTARLDAFGTAIQQPVDLYGVPPSSGAPDAIPDTVVVARASAPFYRAGVTLAGTWRQTAERGLYAQASITAQQFLNPTASPQHQRVSETLPNVNGRLRLGVRFVLFQDLMTDLYADARGWTGMNSRWLHPPTGRLAVPPATTPVPAQPGVQVPASGTLNVAAEAILRGAKLSFTFENVLGNSGVQEGTFIVPVYPLPTRQFRFGVHWPLLN